MSDLSGIWKKCLERLEREIPLEDVNTWLRPLQIESGSDGQVKLRAPNDFVCEQVSDLYLEEIRDFFGANGFDRQQVLIKVGGSTRLRETVRRSAGSGFTAGLDKRYRFDNFVLGKSNELGYAVAQHVSQEPGTAHNPLL
ncbi:MAG: chromosomal replication initiator protein DnaA, partial [Xanthomonadaceae bacterium]|nr:chromosomal replication initiator protein DnaA [Xanthomonadaceae bacterium]